MRNALRQVQRHPLFSLAVAATLALTIGAATTAFGVADAVLWRTLPFGDESRLVFVWERYPDRNGEPQRARVTGYRYAAWRDSATAFTSMALFGAAAFTVESAAGAQTVHGVQASAGYFDTLGIRAVLGRTFAPPDEQPGHERVVVLSDAFWRQRFGADAKAIGQTIRLSGAPYTVIGVMPRAIFPAAPSNPGVVSPDPDACEFWVPIPRTPAIDQSSRAHVFGVVARLAPGFTLSQAQDKLIRAADASAPDPHEAQLFRLRDQYVGDARVSLLLLTAAALAVLLIACANLAALHVSSFESRRAEFATRAAVGAGLWQLMRQLAAEALLLSLCGGAAGALIARLALALMPEYLPRGVPALTLPVMDANAALFATILAVVSGVLMIAWPLVRLVADPPAPRGAAAVTGRTVFRGLVVAQVAVTVALTVCAGLLAQSLRSVQRQDLGFGVDHRLIVSIGLPVAGVPSAPQVAAAERAVLQSVSAVPGITAVAAAYDHPLQASWTDSYRLLGEASPERRRSAELRIVSPGYFEALEVAVVDGRPLTDRDDLSAPGAIVVNEAFARELGGHALGRRLAVATPQFQYKNAVPAEFEIVGVVENERSRGIEQPMAAAMYIGTPQFPQQGFRLIARTGGDPLSMVPDVRTAVRSVNAAITVDRPMSLDGVLADQLAGRRLTTDVITGFSGVALALAALGMYGLLAIMVSSRTREIGVRLALGARPALVGRAIIRDSVVSAAAGVAIGAALAIGAGKLIEGLLVGVKAYDPITIAGVATTLIAVSAAAAVWPARRAASIDPVVALRQEL